MPEKLETVPARHGTATFVPRGQTIKIINTYGKQVVSTWIFALNQAPEEAPKDSEGAAKTGNRSSSSSMEKERDTKKETETDKEKEKEKEKQDNRRDSVQVAESERKRISTGDQPTGAANAGQEKTADPTEVADGSTKKESSDSPAESAGKDKETAQKKGWTNYLPSLKRGKQQGDAQEKGPEKVEETPDAKNTRKWSSYIPSGKGFNTYLPSKDSIAAFTAIHQRDPNASYAEQLYQFSKTPVGAAGISVATGSTTAQSLLAAYNAYTRTLPSSSIAPMEYLSLPHSRIGTRHITPKVHDALLSNLRRPLATLIEDTTSGQHDTLTAACDMHLYASLGVENPEEHNSCAVNLVLALNELNDNTGLKGEKRIGADITVNNAPTPLHLFMNSQYGPEGEIKILEPEGPKGSYVKFRAEVDVVVVMSACPMHLGPQNGGRCMAANFVVENPNPPPTSRPTPVRSASNKKRTDSARVATNAPTSVAEAKRQAREQLKGQAPGRDTTASPSPAAGQPERKKPRKLERRSNTGEVKTGQTV